MKPKRRPSSDEPTPEQLAELNAGPAPEADDDGPSEEQLAELNAAPPGEKFDPRPLEGFEPPDPLMSRAPQTPLNEPPPEKPGFLAGIGQALRGGARALAKTPGEFLDHPAATTRAFVTGQARGATFGAARGPEQQVEEWRGIRERLHTGDSTTKDMEKLRASHQLRSPGAPFNPDAIAADKISRLNAALDDLAKAPNAQVSGELLAPSPVRAAAGKLAAGGGKAAGVLQRGARAVGAGATVGGGEAALRTAAAGGSAGDVLEEGVRGAGAGAVTGLGGAAVTEAARGARKGLQALFPNVKRFAEARETPIQGQSSRYAAPNRFAGPGPQSLIDEAEALPRGNRGVDEAAFGARDRIKSTMQDRAATEGRIYNEGVEALPGMDELQRIPQVHRELNRAVPRLENGRVATGSKGASDLVEGVKKNLTATVGNKIVPVTEAELQSNIRPRVVRHEGYGKWDEVRGMEPDPTRPGKNVVRFDPGEEIKRPAATPRDMLKERRGLRASAFESGAETPETVAARTGYRALNEALKGTDKKPGAIKGLRPLDERYSQHKRSEARTNDILLRSEEGGRTVQLPEQLGAEDFDAAEPAPKWRVNDDARAARTIARINDDTIPARDMAPYFRELVQDPEFKAALDKVVAKKALEETRVLSGPGQGEQVGLHDVSGAGAALKFGVKKLGAIARKADDRVLRHATGGASVPFFGRLGSKKRKQGEEDRP